eukprot:Skav218945  [mRNA]  locus=scaffold678:270609:278709:+ [translate_table: standard]
MCSFLSVSPWPFVAGVVVKVLRSLHQGALDVLRVLRHREAAHEAFPAVLRGIDRPEQHGMVRQPLLGHDRAAFQ